MCWACATACVLPLSCDQHKRPWTLGVDQHGTEHLEAGMAPLTSVHFVTKIDQQLIATALLGVQQEKEALIMFEHSSQTG